jgi:hypothetical protein
VVVIVMIVVVMDSALSFTGHIVERATTRGISAIVDGTLPFSFFYLPFSISFLSSFLPSFLFPFFFLSSFLPSFLPSFLLSFPPSFQQEGQGFTDSPNVSRSTVDP